MPPPPGGEERAAQIKKFAILGVVGLLVLYRVGSPFIAETKKIRKKAEETKKELTRIKHSQLLFTDDWSMDMEKKEAKLKAVFPDKVKTSIVLNHFVKKFEKIDSRTRFLSINPGQVSESQKLADPHDQTTKILMASYSFKALMPSTSIMPYIRHIETYPQLYQLRTMKIAPDKEKKRYVTMDLSAAFYSVPKTWLTEPDVPIAKVRVLNNEDGEESEGNEEDEEQGFGFFGMFGGEEEGEDGEDEGDDEEDSEDDDEDDEEGDEGEDGEEEEEDDEPPELPPLKFNRYMGNGIIIDDVLYEVGDSLHGWKISKISKPTNNLVLKHGELVKNIKLK